MASGRKTSRGKLGRGNRYESLVGQHLVERFGASAVRTGPWIQWQEGPGIQQRMCQPDFLLDLPYGLVVVETKLTQTLRGDQQLQQLYRPLVERIFPDRKVFTVQVFWNIVSQRNLLKDLGQLDGLPHTLVYDWQYIPPLYAKVKRPRKM